MGDPKPYPMSVVSELPLKLSRHSCTSSTKWHPLDRLAVRSLRAFQEQLGAEACFHYTRACPYTFVPWFVQQTRKCFGEGSLTHYLPPRLASFFLLPYADRFTCAYLMHSRDESKKASYWTPPLATPYAIFCPLCLPWSNRIAAGALTRRLRQRLFPQVTKGVLSNVCSVQMMRR